jgi:hypothetical protein
MQNRVTENRHSPNPDPLGPRGRGNRPVVALFFGLNGDAKWALLVH